MLNSITEAKYQNEIETSLESSTFENVDVDVDDVFYISVPFGISFGLAFYTVPIQVVPNVSFGVSYFQITPIKAKVRYSIL